MVGKLDIFTGTLREVMRSKMRVGVFWGCLGLLVGCCGLFCLFVGFFPPSSGWK